MVITIIGILIALLLPAVQAAREAARRMQCTNNLKQQALALHGYHDAFQRFPPGLAAKLDISTGKYTVSGWSWSAFVLPFLESKNVYDLINFSVSVGNMQNNPAIKRFIPAYQCPSAPLNRWVTAFASKIPGEEDAAESHYCAVATHLNTDLFTYVSGSNSVFSGVIFMASATPIADIKDGTSQTFIVSEFVTYDDDPMYSNPTYCPPGKPCAVGNYWAGGSVITTFYGINSHTWDSGYDPCRGVESRHPGGANFAYADGHVSFLGQNIQQETLVVLTTRGPGVDTSSGLPGIPYGGEVIGNVDY